MIEVDRTTLLRRRRKGEIAMVVMGVAGLVLGDLGTYITLAGFTAIWLILALETSGTLHELKIDD